jgi:hypothetical protein
VRLSHRAAFAAERLAEIAGVPAPELVEMVILELAASGEIVEAEAARSQPSKPLANRRAATVIPIERGRRVARRSLERRVGALRRRSEAARDRGAAARQTSLTLRLKCPMRLDGDG